MKFLILFFFSLNLYAFDHKLECRSNRYILTISETQSRGQGAIKLVLKSLAQSTVPLKQEWKLFKNCQFPNKLEQLDCLTSKTRNGRAYEKHSAKITKDVDQFLLFFDSVYDVRPGSDESETYGLGEMHCR